MQVCEKRSHNHIHVDHHVTEAEPMHQGEVVHVQVCEDGSHNHTHVDHHVIEVEPMHQEVSRTKWSDIIDSSDEEVEQQEPSRHRNHVDHHVENVQLTKAAKRAGVAAAAKYYKSQGFSNKAANKYALQAAAEVEAEAVAEATTKMST